MKFPKGDDVGEARAASSRIEVYTHTAVKEDLQDPMAGVQARAGPRASGEEMRNPTGDFSNR